MKIKSSTQQIIARKLGMSASKYTQVKLHNDFTDKKEIAEHFADTFGGCPLDYVKEQWRELYGKMWPSMKKERVTK